MTQLQGLCRTVSAHGRFKWTLSRGRHPPIDIYKSPAAGVIIIPGLHLPLVFGVSRDWVLTIMSFAISESGNQFLRLLQTWHVTDGKQSSSLVRRLLGMSWTLFRDELVQFNAVRLWNIHSLSPDQSPTSGTAPSWLGTHRFHSFTTSSTFCDDFSVYAFMFAMMAVCLPHCYLLNCTSGNTTSLRKRFHLWQYQFSTQEVSRMTLYGTRTAL